MSKEIKDTQDGSKPQQAEHTNISKMDRFYEIIDKTNDVLVIIMLYVSIFLVIHNLVF